MKHVWTGIYFAIGAVCALYATLGLDVPVLAVVAGAFVLMGITRVVGRCDGSGKYAYDPADDNGRGALLPVPCPGCRACS